MVRIRHMKFVLLACLCGPMLPVPATASQAAAGPQRPGTPRKPAPASKPAPAAATPGAGPVIVVETVKGTFEFETYPDDAPKTVQHVIDLTKRGFYNGMRFHRIVPNFIVQVGDPQSRDMSKRDWWGRGDASGSGNPIGVAEISKKHLHVRGAVAMAHPGNPAEADSQFYVTLAPRPQLNGKYAVIGRVISGMDVVSRLQVADVLKKMYVRP
jgi:peptidyl-prolyl cis-trans isomerase B (cyclophilin B)